MNVAQLLQQNDCTPEPKYQHDAVCITNLHNDVAYHKLNTSSIRSQVVTRSSIYQGAQLHDFLRQCSLSFAEVTCLMRPVSS